MPDNPSEQATVEITDIHPQVEAPNSVVQGPNESQHPGPARVSLAVVGKVNGEGPFMAYVPAAVVHAVGTEGFRGPGLHQIIAEAIREAYRHGHAAPPFAHLAGTSVTVGPGVNPEPTPSPSSH